MGRISLSFEYMRGACYEGLGLERVRNLRELDPEVSLGTLGINRLVMGPDFVKTHICFENFIVGHIVFIELFLGSYEKVEEETTYSKG